MQILKVMSHRILTADNAVEVKVEPKSEIDPEIPVMEEEISQEEEPQQTEPEPGGQSGCIALRRYCNS